VCRVFLHGYIIFGEGWCPSFYRIVARLQIRNEEKRRQEAEQMLQRRAEYKEKTKNALAFSEIPAEMKPKRGRGRRAAQDGEILSESNSDNEVTTGGEPRERKPK